MRPPITRERGRKEEATGVGWLGQARASSRHGDDDPAAVGVGDVVEAQKLPWPPANQRGSALVGHGIDIDVGPLERCDAVEESVPGLLGLEAGCGPRTKLGQGNEQESFPPV